MRHSKSVAIVAALAFSSSAAIALTVTHGHWMGTVSGMDGMKTTGSAMMMASADGKGTDVTVNLKGETASVVRPWHVHTGTCASGGGVFGGGKSYTPITFDEKGTGTSKATLAVAVPDSGTYHINLHESGTNMSKIVACGDLKHAE